MQRFSKAEDVKLVYLYNTGFTIAAICKELGRAKSSVTWRIEKLGLERRPKRVRRAKCVKIYMRPELLRKIQANALARGNNVSQYLESLLTRILA